MDYEEALNRCSFGTYQIVLLCACGLVVASDAVEILMVSYLEDGAREDLNFESFGQGLLSALLFAGMLLGGSVIGVFSDKYGRRRMMTATLWLCVLSGGVSAFSVNMPMFLALRFLAGLGVGGSIPVVFTYFAEFLPAKNRGRYIIFLASFWMLGAIFTAGLAWISIEQVGWRVFVALCVIPALTGAILSTFHFIPESPRWNLIHNHPRRCTHTLHRMLRFNHKIRAQPLTTVDSSNQFGASQEVHERWFDFVTPLSLKETNPEQVLENENNLQQRGVMGNSNGIAAYRSVEEDGTSELPYRTSVVSNPLNSHRDEAVISTSEPSGDQLSTAPENDSLVDHASSSTRHSKKTMCSFVGHGKARKLIVWNFSMLTVVWFFLSFGWYGLLLWAPQLMKKKGIKEEDLYLSNFLVALSNLPGNLASAWLVEVIGRKWTLVSSMAVACVSMVLFLLVENTWQNVAAVCLFNGLSVGGWNVLDVQSAEAFPTQIRSTAMGVLSAAGRLGVIVATTISGYFIDTNVSVVLVTNSFAIFLACVGALALPRDGANAALADTADQTEDDVEDSTLPLTSSSSPGGNRSLSQQAANSTQESLRHRQAAPPVSP